MPLLPRKGVLAIAAVVDVAVNARGGPVSAKALAARHQLPPRHLEPVLQALVRDGILKGIRGPRGGYELAREYNQITAEDILRSASRIDENDDPPLPISNLVHRIVQPALAKAEKHFSAALGQISVEEMARLAKSLDKSRQLESTISEMS
jgi:Rrf2 family transcriptional regulator, iron-sulfur cluster assembly transcription factor